MCRPQPYMLYNKSIQNRISIHVQQRSNTNVRWTSSNEQVSDARSSSQSDTGRNGKEKLWTTEIECLRGLVHIRQALNALGGYHCLGMVKVHTKPIMGKGYQTKDVRPNPTSQASVSDPRGKCSLIWSSDSIITGTKSKHCTEGATLQTVYCMITVGSFSIIIESIS